MHLVKQLVDFYDGEVMAFYTVFAPIQQFRLFVEYIIKDVDGFQTMLWEHKEDVARAAEIIADDTILLVEALRAETGIDAHHDEYIKPSDLRVLNRINALWEDNILHICGYENYQNDVEYYASYPAKVYNWAVHTEGVSLARGKEIFDGAVLGGFDNNAGALLHAGTTSEVVEYTTDLIESTGRDRLLLGADCTVPRDISLDRINVVRLAAAALG